MANAGRMNHRPENIAPVLYNRFKLIISVSVQIHKLDDDEWRELTSDFVLLHMYSDQFDGQIKLIALDGVKIIINEFALLPNMQMIRPTKKFAHFVGDRNGDMVMYGFGFQEASEVEPFLRQVSTVHRRLKNLSSVSSIQHGLSKLSVSSSTKSLTNSFTLSSVSFSSEKLKENFIPSFSSRDLPSIKKVPNMESSDAVDDAKNMENRLKKLSANSDTHSTVSDTRTTSTLEKIFMNSESSSEGPDLIVFDEENIFNEENKTVKSDSNYPPSCDQQPPIRSLYEKQYQLWDVPEWSLFERASQIAPDHIAQDSKLTLSDLIYGPIKNDSRTQ